MENGLLIIGLTLLFSAFFSGMEIAFISSNKLQIELESKKGNFSSKLLSKLLKNPANFIATMLVGNNIALVIYGIFMAALLEPWLANYFESDLWILTLQTILSTLLILVTAEFLPKTVFRISANQMLRIFALPARFFYAVFYPIMWIIMKISNGILTKVMKLNIDEEEQVFGRIDLDHFIREHKETIEEQDEVETEIQIFQNALDFSNIKARECMVPRTEVIAVDVEDSIQNLRDKFIESGLAKILVYKESTDNMIGYVHSFELFKRPENIRSILIPVPLLPESMPANEVLDLLIKERKSIAVVLDEFGGTSGIITVEDVMEEIFGEIEDEHDTMELIEKEISDGEFEFSARHEIDYLNEKYKLKLPESDSYETLGGMVVSFNGNIPEKGEHITIEGFSFTVLDASNTRIERLKLTLIDEN